MKINKVLALRGPNIWANFPCLEVWCDLEELKELSSELIPGFNERLMSWLPTMIEHRCSVGERGGFFQRLHRGTYMAHILEHVTLELQTLAGSNVGFGRARETNTDGIYKVAIEFIDETLARAAVDTGFRLIQAAVSGEAFDIAAEIERLRAIKHEVSLGPSTAAIVNAAQARGIPHWRMNTGSLVALGFGAKQRRILTAETDRTSAIAESIAQDKQLTRTLLRGVGVPAPEGEPVSSGEQAWEAAEEIGVPVVVKPRFGNHGRGVTTNLTTREGVLAAYENARREEEDIVVEKFAVGHDHRLLVIGNKLVAAARRDPPQVRGDGWRTIRELVDEINRDPRRSDGHATMLSLIKLDPIAIRVLAEQGYSPESILPAGQIAVIRRNANLSTGGTATDVTDEVHPTIVEQAIDAARVIGLDIAGIDVICQDIRRPLAEQGGIVCEVNAGPGLRMHLEPSEGRPRPVGEAIIDMMFAPGENGRIPVVAVTGVNGKTTTTRLVAHILAVNGKTVGMTCTDGIYIGSKRIDSGDCSGPKSARNVLNNPQVEAAVLETARGGILREGLAFDRCDIAVVTNIGEGDHLGLNDIDTLEKLAKVKRCIVDVVAPTGAAVLNAADPLVAEMAGKCPGQVVFFDRNHENPLLAKRRAEGGRAVFARDGFLVVADGPTEIPLLALDRIPLTHGGRVGFQVENALAATAAAWALGVPAEVIRAGLETFTSTVGKSPGRFNLLRMNGGTVVVDYGHNPSSLLALLDVLAQFPHARRSAVYSAAGDRRDEDLVRQGELLGEAFDRVIVYEDHYLRGREPGEIMRLFASGLAAGKRVKDVQQIVGWQKACELALAKLLPDELLLVQADVVDETMDYLRKLANAEVPIEQITLAEALATPKLANERAIVKG
ncbi:MAG: cyanophycin synthetase [Pirellulaceae bacterium]|nr:cyanophycin synthetase [Pirellulaceae bacterium]